jgi:hypothetical protein
MHHKDRDAHVRLSKSRNAWKVPEPEKMSWGRALVNGVVWGGGVIALAAVLGQWLAEFMMGVAL